MNNIIIPFRANLLQSLGCNKFNCESLLFDGMDDYVDCGNSAALKPNIITVSCWIKGSANTAFTRIISQDGPTGGADAYGFYVTTATNKIVFAIKTDVTGTVTSATSGVVLDNNWHHLVGTYDGSEVILYVDGVAVGSPSAGTSVLSYGSGTLTIGCFSEPTSLPSYLFNGNIDEVAIFNSIIPIGDLWDGSGQPTDLSLLATPPTNWYRMGDNGAYKSPQWLIPNNENKDKVSNYSMNFDSLRYMTVGSITLGVDNIVSLWLKRDVTNTQEALLGENTNSFNYFMLISATNEMYLRFGASVYVGYTSAPVISVLNDTINWINIIVVRTGNSVELFLNGISMGTGTNNNGVPGVIETRFDEVAAANGSFRTTGAFNNVAAWDVNTVLPSDIYNGGTPPDLTTLSTVPVNWWKMGDNSTWTPTTWNVPDEIGTNNGTIDFLDIFGRIGEAPNSENNAVTINMDFVDVVADTP